MSEFEELWKFATRHGTIQQDKLELNHIYDLLKDCESYLEIGCAEGASLSVLGHGKKKVAYVDWDEDHTRKQRQEVLEKIGNVTAIHGNTHDAACVDKAESLAPFDAVLIDAGHSYDDVIQDFENYNPLAQRFVIFHDMQLPEVRKAVEYCISKHGLKNVRTFINSDNYGYGIVGL